MNPEEIKEIARLIADLNLENSSLMWAAIAYFGFSFAKSVLGYILLGAIGIYWAKTVKYLMERRARSEDED